MAISITPPSGAAAENINKTWLEAVAASNVADIKAEFGNKLSYRLFGGQVYSPRGLWKDPITNEFYLAQESTKGRKFTYDGKNFNIIADFGPEYGTPTTTNTLVASVWQIDATADKMLHCMYGRHAVRVYDRTTNALLSTIGNFTAGTPEEGKVQNPSRAYFLPNGNVIVVSYNGNAGAGVRAGSLTEWNISTPIATLVAVRMHGGTSTSDISAVGKNVCFGALSAFIDRNDKTKIWLVEHQLGNSLLRADISTGIVDRKFVASDPNKHIFNGYVCLQLEDGNIFICSPSSKNALVINQNTGVVEKEIKINAGDIYGAFELANGKIILFSSSSYNEGVVIDVDGVGLTYTIPTIPSGWEVAGEYLPEGLNITTGAMNIDYTDIETLKQKLAIPLRRS